MYEWFEHTADLGLRVEAANLNDLFRDAARGLFAMIVERVPGGEGGQRREFRIAGSRRDWLLLDWLNELLYTFDTERLLFDRFEVRVFEEGLEATARGVLLDVTRDALCHEVKAITYHGLLVERTDNGWCAEVIVDI